MIIYVYMLENVRYCHKAVALCMMSHDLFKVR